MKALDWSDISPIVSLLAFSTRSKAANSAVYGLICPNFKTIKDFIVVLVTHKKKEEPIKYEGCRVVITLFDDFSANSVVGNRILLTFDLF